MKQPLNEPLLFKPYLKSVIWGGTKIAKLKGIESECTNIGESWEVSVVPGHESVVESGTFAGRKLNELVDEYKADLVGTKVLEQFGTDFPLLIKFIDAQSDLSVQVHPDDALAKARHNSAGKTEMWYVMDRENGAHIYSGLCAPLNRDEYVTRIAEQTIMDVVGSHESQPGQFYFIPAGTIHAIGAGNLIAEIQQSSDITYRVYDYNRKDKDGNTRELHVEQARDAIDYTFPNDKATTTQPLDHSADGVISCKYFTTDYIKEDGKTIDVSADGTSFVILIVTEGTATLTYADKEISLRQGQTVLIPASLTKINLKVKGQTLKIHI
jgi:mannose-6-phosphate isomerase